MDPSGKYVEAIAAKESRTPDRSYDIISDLSDFSLTQTDDRDQKMQLYYKIYHKDYSMKPFPKGPD